MHEILSEILAEAPRYNDDGAGRYNAGLLNAARVRPAFFDVSCLIYRLLYAKADDYVRKCGLDTDKISNWAAADVVSDVADACRHCACAPVLCFDSARSFRKEEIYPEYKAGRGAQKKSVNEELVLSCKPNVVRLLKLVYAPGYKMQAYCVHGYESDDIIASFVLGLKQHGLCEEAAFQRQVVIVSSDHDLHQLVFDDVHWADVSTGALCQAEDLFKHNGIHPKDIVAAKCVGGCTSDNIGNVTGCGEVTVKEVLSKRSDDVKVKKARAALQSEEGEKILRRNLKLIRLPYSGAQPMLPLRLSKKWPVAGVPEDMAALMQSHGIPQSSWPSFADITLPQPQGAIPSCGYAKKGTSQT